MKKQVLITVSYIAEIDENLLTGKMEKDRREKFEQPLNKRFPRTMKISDDIRAKWDRSSIILLDPKYHNCTKCSACDSWITDKRKPNCVAGLPAGEYLGENIYCPECAEVRREKIYKPLPIVTEKPKALEILKNGSRDDLILLPLSLGEYFDDWKFAQDLCLELAKNVDAEIRANAVLGLAYIARTKGVLEKHLVEPVLLKELRENIEHNGRIQDAIEDINIYLNWNRQMESNFNQYNKMLLAYPKIRVIKAAEILPEILRKYQDLAITDMHYLWSHKQLIPKKQERYKPSGLKAFYETELLKKLPADVELYLIIDCCDGSFIVCLSEIENYIELLRDNYFELVEFYFADTAKNIILSVDHAFNVRWYV